jgi:hypothetical protein
MNTMIRSKIAMLAVLAAVSGGIGSAQANTVLGPTTVDLPNSSPGGSPLSVDYYVSLCGSTYSYYFVLTPPSGSALTSFTVDITGTALVRDITSTSSAYVPPPVIDNGTSITWLFSDLTGNATASFQSQSSPVLLGMTSANSVNDAFNGSWVDPAIPEPSTIFAGVLMLLPLSIGILRAVRKSRDLNDMRLATEPGFQSPAWSDVPNATQNVP